MPLSLSQRSSVAWLCRSLALAPLLVSAAGCGYTQNVRAYRAYAYESPSLEVALDRTGDLAAALTLVDQLLTRTPVDPDAAWLKRLPLSDAEARTIRQELREREPYSRNPSYEVPVVKIYRVHLERLLDEASKSGGSYPSVMDALGALGQDSGKIREHWEAHRVSVVDEQAAEAAYDVAMQRAYPPGSVRNPLNDPPAVVEASQKLSEATEERRRNERDLERDIESLRKGGGEAGASALRAVTDAVSVAYRVDLEALAMIPIIAVQATRALPRARDELASSPGAALRSVERLADVPGAIDTIKEQMSRQTRLLELMTSALVASSRSSLEATAGFALKESVVDQVVGVTLDSFRAQAKVGAEAFFFSAIQQQDKQEQQQQDGSIRKDFTGRLRTLSYDVKPILFTAAQLSLGFDYIRLPNAAGLSFGYKTDRVFSSGGTIESGSLSQQLGVDGLASQALDFGLGVLGVKSAVRVATFTTGTVRYSDAAGNPLIDANGRQVSAPLQINYTQIDLGYDIAFLLGEKAGKAYIEELTFGARYFKYQLPRILYELENTLPPESKDKNFVYRNESAPQTVPSKYYMGGFNARFGRGEGAVLTPFGELGIYVGGGPTSFSLRQKKAVLCEPGLTPSTSQECVDNLNAPLGPRTQATALAANATLALGMRLRFLKPGRRLRLSGELLYRAELIYASTSSTASDSGNERSVEFGTTDLFHGPRFNFVGEF